MILFKKPHRLKVNKLWSFTQQAGVTGAKKRKDG